MISDLDIYRCAKQLVDWYGDQAMAEAEAMKARYEEKGDREGAAAWWRVAEAISALNSKAPDRSRGPN